MEMIFTSDADAALDETAELVAALKQARQWIAHLCEPFGCDDMVIVMKIDAALARAAVVGTHSKKGINS